jgi:hypothetical protein
MGAPNTTLSQIRKGKAANIISIWLRDRWASRIETVVAFAILFMWAPWNHNRTAALFRRWHNQERFRASTAHGIERGRIAVRAFEPEINKFKSDLGGQCLVTM